MLNLLIIIRLPPAIPQSSPGPYVDLSLNYTYMDGGVMVVGFHNAYNQTDLGATITGGRRIPSPKNEESSTAYINITQTLKPISPRLSARFPSSTSIPPLTAVRSTTKPTTFTFWP